MGPFDNNQALYHRVSALFDFQNQITPTGKVCLNKYSPKSDCSFSIFVCSLQQLISQELEVWSLYHLYSLKTKSSRCHYIVITRSETKLSVAIPAQVSVQLAVNVATATSKCSITFLLPYNQDGDDTTKQDNVSNIL